MDNKKALYKWSITCKNPVTNSLRLLPYELTYSGSDQRRGVTDVIQTFTFNKVGYTIWKVLKMGFHVIL